MKIIYWIIVAITIIPHAVLCWSMITLIGFWLIFIAALGEGLYGILFLIAWGLNSVLFELAMKRLK